MKAEAAPSQEPGPRAPTADRPASATNATAAPDAAVPMRGGGTRGSAFGPPGARAGAGQHRSLVALQRSAGNRAVAGLVGSPANSPGVGSVPAAPAAPSSEEVGSVPADPTVQRDVTVQRDPPPPPIGGAVAVTGGAGKPSISGTTRSVPIDFSKVRIEGPNTSFTATDVGLQRDAALGNGKSILVGVMQTLMGSVRNAHYRSPGTPPTDPPIVKKSTMDQSRDALASMGDDGTVIQRPGANAPFYSPPETLSDVKPDGTIRFNEDRTADLMDRPGWAAKTALGRGEFEPKLVGTSGADRFLTSVAAKYTDAPALAHLNKVSWEVPWDIAIDEFGGGTGGAGTVEASDIPPPETEGDIAAVKAKLGGGKDWIVFPSLGDAMMCPTHVLLGNLAASRQNDPTSFGFTLDALIARNPTFSASITVSKKLRGVGKERLTASVSTSAMTYTPPRSELDEGGTMTFGFALNGLYNRENLAAGDAITVSLSVVPVFGDAKSSSTTMSQPFLPIDTTVAIDGGSYQVHVRYKG